MFDGVFRHFVLKLVSGPQFWFKVANIKTRSFVVAKIIWRFNFAANLFLKLLTHCRNFYFVPSLT